MSNVDQSLVVLRHQYGIVYGAKPSEDFARHAVVSIGMSAAVDAARDAYAWVETPDDVVRARAAVGDVTHDLRDGLRRLGEMAGMPDLAEVHAERAADSYWGQLTLMARHREANARMAPSAGPGGP